MQDGANLHGRTWAMMYDLSGMQPGAIEKRVMEDWKLLVDRMKIREDRAYLHHEGKPVVAVWGVGFSDGRKYSLEECEPLLQSLKEDPEYGENTVKIGLSTHWRTLARDAVADKKLHGIVRLADIVSPWTVGRYKNPGQVRTHAKTTVAADIEWCSVFAGDFPWIQSAKFEEESRECSRTRDDPTMWWGISLDSGIGLCRG